MLEFSLPDMSCGHCVSKITKTCKLVDPHAKVDVDLGARKVRVVSSEIREDFAEALAEAGYPPSA